MSTQPVTPSPAAKVVAPTPATNSRQPREHRRTPYRVPCRVEFRDRATGQARTVVGETVNLSKGGMALQVGVDAAIGTWVETLVPHPNGDPLFLCGTVVHSRRTLASSYEIGVTIRQDAPRAFV